MIHVTEYTETNTLKYIIVPTDNSFDVYCERGTNNMYEILLPKCEAFITPSSEVVAFASDNGEEMDFFGDIVDNVDVVYIINEHLFLRKHSKNPNAFIISETKHYILDHTLGNLNKLKTL